MSAMLFVVLLTGSGCCDKGASFQLGCVDDCNPQLAEKIVYKEIDIPEEIMVCSKLPDEPVEAKKQSEIAAYIAKLWLVADECKSNLAKTKQIVDNNNTGD